MKNLILRSLLVTATLFAVTANAQLVNLGLVGVGRVSGNSFDALGPNVDTLGGIFSGLYLNPGAVTQSGATYSARAFALPDRGFGDGLTDYHPRVQTLDISVTPYYGPYPATAQNQIFFTNTATLLFRQNNALFTGYNADDTNVQTHPQSPATSPGAGKWSLDPEGVVRTADGNFYVSDEYGPLIYNFSSSGVLLDVLVPPMAIIPKTGDAYPRPNNFGVAIPQVATNDSGRWVNRGLEGLSITPDGRKLVSILQSPCIQDGENRNPSRNTRILVFDLNPASSTYHEPIAEYTYQCTLNAAEARNRHTPISEILALSDTQFLVLERDSRGRGGDAGPILYKKVVLADVRNASNILNTGYDLEKGAPGQLSLPRATLPASIVPAARRELVDIADPRQLAKFGLNTSTNWDQNTLSEKWEGLAVIPLNDPAAPNDYLLLIGNDNDFRAPLVYHNGVIVGTNEITSDNMLLAFRIGADVTPPTLICPGPITVAANTNCALSSITGHFQASDNSADPVQLTQVPAVGAVGLGTHAVTVTATDSAGNSTNCTVMVAVADQTAPVITGIIASVTNIWPANHQFVPVRITAAAIDNCDTDVRLQISEVASNEPVTSRSDKTTPDWFISGSTVWLRAEATGKPAGRVYTIILRATDDAGNTSKGTTTVTVAKPK